MEKICCFIGHSEIPVDISEPLTAAVERHITEYGVTDFLVGQYGQFDRMAARTVMKAKERHPNIRLYLMLPYHPSLGRHLPDREGYDGFIYPADPDVPPFILAIPRLNRIIVRYSGYAIAFVRYTWGGAATTLDYARRRERKKLIHIENLAAEAF